MTTLFGLTARLILEDAAGEFEVRDAFVYPANLSDGSPRVDIKRLLDAIDKRRCAAHDRRPVY